MSDIVLKIENVSKEYMLGTLNHQTLFRETQSFLAKIMGKEDPNRPIRLNENGVEDVSYLSQSNKFLALDGVSFQVNRGESYAILGRNGAGKSTLLKIISRVTMPSSGTVKIKGKVSSLLEVGTGFHPELSGMDNIYLNGAILGMKRREIKRRIDEIIDFSELARFIDTPVKRYSSGMYVRLAFSIAVHFIAEIVILDEVLSVGDQFFVQKCMKKMEDVLKREGRTVLFVSHSLPSVRKLCESGVILQNGRVLKDGGIDKVIEYYANTVARVA